MLAAGHIAGDYLYIDQPDYIRLLKKYNPAVTGGKMQPFPTMPQMAANAGQAVGRVAQALLRGEKVFVTDKEIENRLKICQNCEFYSNGRCAKCGCFNKWKAKLKTEHCPIGKW